MNKVKKYRIVFTNGYSKKHFTLEKFFIIIRVKVLANYRVFEAGLFNFKLSLFVFSENAIKTITESINKPI